MPARYPSLTVSKWNRKDAYGIQRDKVVYAVQYSGVSTYEFISEDPDAEVLKGHLLLWINERYKNEFIRDYADTFYFMLPPDQIWNFLRSLTSCLESFVAEGELKGTVTISLYGLTDHKGKPIPNGTPIRSLGVDGVEIDNVFDCSLEDNPARPQSSSPAPKI